MRKVNNLIKVSIIFFTLLVFIWLVYLFNVNQARLILATIAEQNTFGFSESYPLIPPGIGMWVYAEKNSFKKSIENKYSKYPTLRIHFVSNAILGGLDDIDKHRSLSLLKIMLEKGDSIDERDSFGCTILQYAVNQADGEFVKFLIENGANPLLSLEKGVVNNPNPICLLSPIGYTEKKINETHNLEKYGNLLQILKTKKTAE